ncbi:cytochrome c peroxidase [Rhizobium pisi]|uniref:Methylamine utilization protein MauG n=2 Tax=Rhizobium TaxID=379 RepID=A0A7W6BEG2_9HYPH|nr:MULTISPECIES: cytochrome c peroxidase [Rhizobium]MBB3137892.1 cytochrome c peroxidase [Rhizobium pisi]MBB3916111.1 cytochrome c peroxidase [Rhizobium fabae]RSB65664.1 tryptophan tryptophylquinone biosynthesis enzyme MauG [Rhizobium pisi]RUM11120.1 tryptophan tryptophylquinone biosynthesis enzyme MauG [Rhizobium fabae]TCA44814.1 c-type cytochrome [Rhizobium pisi]
MRFLVAVSLFAIAAVQPGAAGDLSAYKRPLTVPFEKVTAYSPQLATLGKMLFFDPRLSGNKNMTCASCHNPSFGFETPVKTPIGAANTALGRQAPTVLNVAWVSPFFWDGRAPNLEEQAAGPITASAEMNGKLETAVTEMQGIPDYKKWFGEVFPDKGISRETILTAIATYERTVVSNWSPFDRWVDGDEKAVSDSAKRGFDLFTGSAGCSACHSGWNFTDNKFHDIGMPDEDLGRFKIDASSPNNQHAFKTPGLRNTLYRGPYMHDGSLKSMDEVIAHYESGGVSRPSLDPAMTAFLLTDEDRNDLIAFLGTLTAEKQDIPLPTLPN